MKIVYTTSDTFRVMRIVMESEELTIKQHLWLRKLYASAASNLALSQKQAEIASDICRKANLNLDETFKQGAFQ
jgi:hypothetical protein